MTCNLVVRDSIVDPTSTWVIPFEFDGEHTNIDPEKAIRAAVKDYLKSPESKEARDEAGDTFNWGDVMANIPDKFFENRGMYPTANTSINIEVEHDEILCVSDDSYND